LSIPCSLWCGFGSPRWRSGSGRERTRVTITRRMTTMTTSGELFTRVMSIDAGQSTGVAIIDYPDNGPMQVVHLDQFVGSLSPTVEELLWLNFSYQPGVVAAERFDLRPGNKFLA